LRKPHDRCAVSSAPSASLLLGVIALAGCGGDTGTGPQTPIGTETLVDLQVGEAQAIENTSEAILLRFDETSANREYQIVIQSASEVDGAKTTMQVRGAIASTAVVAPAASASRPTSGALTRTPSAFELSGVRQDEQRELTLRRSARAALRRHAAIPSPAGRLGGSFGLSAAPPQQGDTMRFALAVQPDLTVSCTDTAALITAVVRRVGQHITVVEDIQTAPTAFTQADYDELEAAFDSVVFETVSTYFGSPADIDGNERVIALFTPEVNRLNPRGANTFIGGFFIPSDLAAPGPLSGGGGSSSNGYCATSNEAEILYLLAPDPSGQFSDAVGRDEAIRTGKGVTAHEFQHLLSAERRIFFNNASFDRLEDIWLAEGLSHIAEEVAGFRAAGLAPRGNIPFSTALADIDAFNTYQITNYGRLQSFFRNPNGTLAIAAEDPGGFESLEMRGFAWIFARWLADHARVGQGPGVLGGAPEEAIFQHLSSGGPNSLQGIANVERAVAQTGGSSDWAGLLADYAMMPAVDDAGVGGIDPRFLLLTWNLTDVFFGLSSNSGSAPSFPEAYPLDIDRRGFTNFVTAFDLSASTAKYFTLRSQAAAPAYTFQILGSNGTEIPASARVQVTILRTL
jgi:hypothetical protein